MMRSNELLGSRWLANGSVKGLLVWKCLDDALYTIWNIGLLLLGDSICEFSGYTVMALIVDVVRVL